jgi:hypothetical protein
MQAFQIIVNNIEIIPIQIIDWTGSRFRVRLEM